MALQPGASVKSKYDLTRSYFPRREEYALTAAANLVEEGQLMVAAGTTLQQAVPSTAVAATDAVPLGVALLGEISATTFAHYETFTIPAALTYTLKYNNLVLNPYTGGGGVLADAFVWDTTRNAEIVVVAPVAGAGQCSINTNTGVITMAAGGGPPLTVGDSCFIRYRWTMTTVQAQEIVRQSAIGRGSENTFRKVVIGRGTNCRIFTTTFDADAIWTLNLQNGAGNSPCTGLNGVWSTITNTTMLIGPGLAFGRVISLPSANDPYLGIEYTTP